MKKIKIQLVLSASIICFLLLLNACGSDPAPSAKDQTTTALISGAWKTQNVSVDGTDQTNVYKGLVLTFTKTGFTSTNGSPVWPANGTWSFIDDTATSIVRNDGLEISITEATATKLILKLSWAKGTIKSGRQGSVGGQNTFTFGH